MTTRGRAHDQRDLRDHAGGLDIAVENLAVEAEGDDALLDTRAGAFVDTDERAAGLQRQIHHLDDLLAVDLAEAAAEHGDVLAEDADVAAVDGAVAGDDTVAERTVVLQAEVHAAVAGQRVELDEGALVEQREDALAGGHLALGVHLVDCGLTHRVFGFVQPIPQVSQLPSGGVDIGEPADSEEGCCWTLVMAPECNEYQWLVRNEYRLPVSRKPQLDHVAL